MDTGTPQVYVQRVPEGGGRFAVSIKGGAYPHWSADGSTLTYVQLDGQKGVGISARRLTGLEDPKGSLSFGTPKKLFPWKYFFNIDGPKLPTVRLGERSEIDRRYHEAKDGRSGVQS